METKQKTGIAISTLMILGLLTGSYIFQDDNLYFCEDRMITYNCNNLSIYYGLENGKCLNVNGNKLCRSGWEQIYDDRINEEEHYIAETQHDSKQIVCDNKGCRDYN